MTPRVCSLCCLALLGCAAGTDHRDARQVTAVVETPAPPATAMGESTTDAGPPRRRAARSTGPCSGFAPEGFVDVMALRAGQARRCYDLALRENPNLEGRLQIKLRIDEDGAVGSVVVIVDEMGNEVLRNCVTEMFERFVAPRPTGGCIDVLVPLNFRKTDPDAGADAAAPKSP